MNSRSKFFRLALLATALSLALALPTARRSSARQSEGRGAVGIRVEGGKELKLYEKSYALVVGVSEYTRGWPSLPGVKKDVEEVSRALERHGFLVTKVENPNSVQLEKSFKEFIDAYGRGVETRLLFYFAGHGHTVRQSYGEEMGYIVPSDAPLPARDPSGFMSKAMDMQQMELYARRIQSKHALFLFDSCFSGVLFALSRAVPDAITYKTARPVRQFITSGSADEQVSDQSIFRRQFVEALDGEADVNKDGYVTGTELGEFLQDRVINYSRDAQHPQYGKIRNPNLDKGDFVFALPKAPKQPPPAPVPARAEPTATSAGIELVRVPPGSFLMGSRDLYVDDEPIHRVTIRESFYMGKYEVTQAQWRKLMGDIPRPEYATLCADCAVTDVSWDDAITFIVKLNALNDGYAYRLPSEAEWEYAARAGTTGDFAGDLDAMGWYANNAGKARLDADEIYRTDRQNYYRRVRENGVRVHPVGTRLPNAFGLFDMHGNVEEWCQDWYHDNYVGAPADGSAWLTGGEQKRRVTRGGSWWDPASECTSAYRMHHAPDYINSNTGFRVVAVARQ